MESRYVSVKSLRHLSKKNEYPSGANSPTVVTRYKCLCGKGEIVKYDTVGFNDCFVTLACKECEKIYHSFIDISGEDFKLYLME